MAPRIIFGFCCFRKRLLWSSACGRGSGLSCSGWDKGTSPRAEGSYESTLRGLCGLLKIGSPRALAAPSSASMERLLRAGGLREGQKSNEVTREPLRGHPGPPPLSELEDDFDCTDSGLTKPDLSRRRGVWLDLPFGLSSRPWIQALLPSSLGPGSCYLGAPAGFLSCGKRWWLCAVASPRTWGLEVVLCNLRRPDSAQGPSGFLPTLMALPLRILKLWMSLSPLPQFHLSWP